MTQLEEKKNGLRHYEYWPVINPRAHSVSGQPCSINKDLIQQWTSFLTFLVRKSALDSTDLLRAAYYMASMDRLDEAEGLLARALHSGHK